MNYNDKKNPLLLLGANLNNNKQINSNQQIASSMDQDFIKKQDLFDY